jgi:2,4-dienoyl-CoA reductase-like NADH-dependent reductase (Old Yellow Enzyme family)
MQITGATPVAPSVEWSDICLWNIDDSVIPGYQRLAAAVHEEGGTMLAQLAHPGPTEYEGPEVISASRVFSEVTRQVAVPATPTQLAQIVEQYAEAADRCRRGDLDGVEISMAHGLLLASFLSPLTNQRSDEFGGDFERRLELPRRVLRAVRQAIGAELILGIRLGSDDLVKGGITPIDAAQIARALESEVDYISVMVGNNNRLEARVRHWPPTPAKPGLFREVAHTVKAAVSVPVAMVGRVTTLALANDIVAAGDADLVGIVRGHIADPALISKTRSGHATDVRPCVGVNVCTNGLLAGRPLTCMVNADAGDPAALPEVNLRGHRSVVVGAGPAGLEAARRLAERGSTVTLLDRSATLGGQMAAWTSAPSRVEVQDFLSWQERQLHQLGVDIRLQTPASVDLVERLDPHDVIVATGSVPSALVLEHDDGTVALVDALTAFSEPPSGTVVVFDEVGQLDGALITEFLHAAGRNVLLATSRIHVGEGEGINTLYPMLRTLGDEGVPMLERVRPVAVRNGEIHLAGIFGGPVQRVRADAIVWWSGGVPVLDLHHSLSSTRIRTHLVGDALRPRRTTDAVADAKAAVAAIAVRPAELVR